MRRFEFRLSRLARLRDVRRQEARAVLARALDRVQRAERKRTALIQALDDALGAERPQAGPLDTSVLKAEASWQAGMRIAIGQAGALVQAERRKADEAAAAYTRIARDHRVLERLRERQFDRWKRDNELEEQKFLDEIHRTPRRKVSGDDDA